MDATSGDPGRAHASPGPGQQVTFEPSRPLKTQFKPMVSMFWHQFEVKSTIPNHPKAKEINGFLAFGVISKNVAAITNRSNCNWNNAVLAFLMIP